MKHWARSVLEELLWEKGTVSDRVRIDVMRIVELLEERDTHLFRTAELEDIANQISVCTDLSEVSHHMWDLTTTFGFEHFAIFVLKEGLGTSFSTKICTSFNQKWIERYVQENYQYVDPVMAKAECIDGCFLFSDLTNSAPMVRDFWDDAKKHRIGDQGICFAMTRPNGTRVGVSFSTQKTAKQLEEMVSVNLYDMNFLVQLAADAFCHTGSAPALPDNCLSVSELRFLQVLSKSPNPEDALKVTSCFGSNDTLQASIRAKLNVETVYQAIAIAASRGWFNSLPYDKREISKLFPPLIGLQKDSPEIDSSEAIQESQSYMIAPDRTE
ncbi:autoinducer binding domain-containing protein [uncultured Roseobacter sp.]|uniref:autoinducer binding domain-containing protein n=1 Tax=uncultured Roseobacter sp. TaxID=114847 RepID=UPI002607CFA9|nr:autoinducer binding domain-containing protein [uncultured Roseobacter sp.]